MLKWFGRVALLLALGLVTFLVILEMFGRYDLALWACMMVIQVYIGLHVIEVSVNLIRLLNAMAEPDERGAKADLVSGLKWIRSVIVDR